MEKQLVNLSDVIELGETKFNKYIIGDDENVRDKFINAYIYLDNKK